MILSDCFEKTTRNGEVVWVPKKTLVHQDHVTGKQTPILDTDLVRGELDGEPVFGPPVLLDMVGAKS